MRLKVEINTREHFAVHGLGSRPVQRRRLLAEHLAGPMPGDGRVDEEEGRSVVTEAVGARNSWKRILRRCAPLLSSRAT